jgi:hypothetical protein
MAGMIRVRSGDDAESRIEAEAKQELHAAAQM